ncbi:hypothetical protein HY095_00205 [Candidatus Micrarchaeota archaeon]|nr:hypothetical protein [Candidatus Micrarchaeota archaeon]
MAEGTFSRMKSWWKGIILGNVVTSNWRRYVADPWRRGLWYLGATRLGTTGKWDAGEMVMRGGMWYRFHYNQAAAFHAYRQVGEGGSAMGINMSFPTAGNPNSNLVMVPAQRPHFLAWMWMAMFNRNALQPIGIQAPNWTPGDIMRYFREWRYYGYTPAADIPNELRGLYLDGVGLSYGKTKEEAAGDLGKWLTDPAGQTVSLQFLKEIFVKRFRANGVFAITSDILADALSKHTIYDDDVVGGGYTEDGSYVEPPVKSRFVPGSGFAGYPQGEPVSRSQQELRDEFNRVRTRCDEITKQMAKMGKDFENNRAALEKLDDKERLIDEEEEFKKKTLELAREKADLVRGFKEKRDAACATSRARLYQLDELSPEQVIKLYNYFLENTMLDARRELNKEEEYNDYLFQKYLGGKKIGDVYEFAVHGLTGAATLESHNLPLGKWRGMRNLMRNSMGIVGFGWQNLPAEVGGNAKIEFAMGRDFWPTLTPVYMSKARRFLATLNEKDGRITDWAIKSGWDVASVLEWYRQSIKGNGYRWLRKGILDDYQDIAAKFADIMGVPDMVTDIQLNLHTYSNHDSGEEWDAMRRSLAAFKGDLELTLPQYVIEGYPGGGSRYIAKRLTKRFNLMQSAVAMLAQMQKSADQEKKFDAMKLLMTQDLQATKREDLDMIEREAAARGGSTRERNKFKAHLEAMYSRHWLSKDETGVNPEDQASQMIALVERYRDLWKLFALPALHADFLTPGGEIPYATAAKRGQPMPHN